MKDKQPIEEAGYTAELHNAKPDPIYRKSFSGNIYNDKRNRWSDGTFITTSTVVKEVTCPFTHDRFIYTLNSIYKLVNKQ